MFSEKEYLKAIAENYASAIEFNREITGNEPMPRSSNIAKIARAKDGREWGLYVEFFGAILKDGTTKPNSGYLYKSNDWSLWQELVMGAEVEGRTSTGRVFHQKVKAAKIPFERVW